MSTNTTSNVFSPINYKLELKRLVVTELRNYFYNISPSETVNNINCTLEYPNTPEKYPAVIVGYTEKSLHNAGLGNMEFTPDGLSLERWLFDGEIKIDIRALTNLERDYVSDHIVGLFSFGLFLQIPFESDVVSSSFIDIQTNLKTLTPIAEQTMSGVTWGLTDSRIYSCGYSFKVLGAFTSMPSYDPYIAQINSAVLNTTDAIPNPMQNITPPAL
jgi:hypothetical protein